MNHGHFGRGKYPAVSKAPFPVTGAVRSDLARVVRRELSKMGFEPNGAVDPELIKSFVEDWLQHNPPIVECRCGGGPGGGDPSIPSLGIDIDGVPYIILGGTSIFMDERGVPYFVVGGGSVFLDRDDVPFFYPELI